MDSPTASTASSLLSSPHSPASQGPPATTTSTTVADTDSVTTTGCASPVGAGAGIGIGIGIGGGSSGDGVGCAGAVALVATTAAGPSGSGGTTGTAAAAAVPARQGGSAPASGSPNVDLNNTSTTTTPAHTLTHAHAHTPPRAHIHPSTHTPPSLASTITSSSASSSPSPPPPSSSSSTTITTTTTTTTPQSILAAAAATNSPASASSFTPTPTSTSASTPTSTTHSLSRPLSWTRQHQQPQSPLLRPRSPSASPHARAVPVIDTARKLARNVSPGLLARMKFLNNQTSDSSRPPPLPQASQVQIGRISESKIRELDDFHRERSARIERRGTAWSRSSSQVGTPLIVPQLTGDSVPALIMDQSPPPGFESDRSSFVSTSDRILPSDSEAGEDTQKYRLPDLTKSSKTLGQQQQQLPIADGDGDGGAFSDVDAHAALAPDRPPTPPPKDSPPLPVVPVQEVSVLDDNDGIDVAAYFHRRHLTRATSIYTLSRASFTNQIQQLTSITLPPAATLSSNISKIPTSTAAGRALHEAANQIKLWMAKASEVLNGLDAEDDVEWAAAAGREGLEEVDIAIGKFEGLVSVYITAIEDLQARPDITSLPRSDLTRLVAQMEDVVGGWSRIKKTLKGIKTQVEVAMEWEELWNTVLGEIGHEIEELTRLVFEMEERRHRAITDSVAESAEKFDIADLETIVEETPRHQARLQNNRSTLAAPATILSPHSPIPQIEQENSRLLALFAKLQPLRASLDFLPMRLSSFHLRASKMFPSACDELMRRKEVLEKLEKKLEADADALREELGEDKWVHSFRQAGSKAIAMYESFMKSIQRLRQAINDNDEEKLGSRVATYKDKREHYPPSMKRVCELIDIEMKNRSTVNGEILRIQQDVRQKMTDLEQEIKDMNMVLDELTCTRKLRDSVSTVLSSRTEASLAGSAFDNTPNSSPSSSIIMSRRSGDYSSLAPSRKKLHQPSNPSTRPSLPANRRYSNLPTATSASNVPRKALTTSRLDALSTPSRAMSSTPTSAARSITPGSDKSTNKPRWNGSTSMRDTVVGHNFKPLSVTTPSPYRKEMPPRTLRSVSSHSSIPVRSHLSLNSALSPPPQVRPASTTPGQQHLLRRPMASTLQTPSPSARPRGALKTSPSSMSLLSVGTPSSTRHVQIAEEDEGERTVDEESPSARRLSRPASAMTSRRTSLLPTPKQRTTSGSVITSLTSGTPARSTSRLGNIDEGRKSRLSIDGGRTSRFGGRKSSVGMSQSSEENPRWKI